jgi:hypothetical protein
MLEGIDKMELKENKTSLSDAIDFITDEINVLEEDLSQESDKVKVFHLKCELENYKNVLRCLYEL